MSHPQIPTFLEPCSSKPNCVCSQNGPTKNIIAPFGSFSSATKGLLRLKMILQENPRFRLVTSTSHYLRAEARTRWLGFVDDVEFLASESEGLIHVKSASRLGYYDFGVNRRRLERLRQQLAQTPS